MAEVRSTFELKPGAQAPQFELPDASGQRRYRSTDLLEGKDALVVVFACNHCPYVKHLAPHLGEFAAGFAKRNVGFVAINSNDTEAYPEDGPSQMIEFAAKHGWDFPYLWDETQEVAKAYYAACTPDFFLFNSKGELCYTGQYDGSRPGNAAPVTGAQLRAAIESTLRGVRIDPRRNRPSSGCNIKWKTGGEPAYFG
ncbi:MAG: Peroxiredoxin [Verrucomicrobia bacterium]|nr:MAG: Peroxiredoxin [Verrucomicrobiota bacterium]